MVGLAMTPPLTVRCRRFAPRCARAHRGDELPPRRAGMARGPGEDNYCAGRAIVQQTAAVPVAPDLAAARACAERRTASSGPTATLLDRVIRPRGLGSTSPGG